jgi:hypothetical protein
MKWLLVLFIPASMAANGIDISADEVEYGGEEVVLTGAVQLEHESGKMSSSKAVLSPGETSKMGRLHLEQNVKVTLPDGSLLACDTADFDRESRSGTFSSQQAGGRVIFSTQKAQVASDTMGIQLITEGGKRLTADDHVVIKLAEGLTARTDHATYKDSGDGSSGRFRLLPGERGVCEVRTTSGDIVRASSIEADGAGEELLFTDPDGVIRMETETVHFSGRSLTWNDLAQNLVLAGDVFIHQSGFGRLKSNQEVEIRLGKSDLEKRTVQEMISRGTTVIAYVDESSKEKHTVTCYDTVRVDHTNLKTYLTSPSVNGKVPPELRVRYSDRMGQITADAAILIYSLAADSTKPILTDLIIEGNVRILNDAPWDPNDNTTVLQYALADELQYTPATQKMVLRSRDENRVLFYDQVNSLQVSAVGIELVRNGRTQQNAIKGIGDVRFTMIEHELEEMRRLFRLQGATAANLSH